MKQLPTVGEQFLPKFLRDYLGETGGKFEVSFQARLSESVADCKFSRDECAPERANIAHMKQLPTVGERFMLKFLRDYLDETGGEFEVSFQARLSKSLPMSLSCGKITVSR